MKMSQGVEWSLHCLVTLTTLPEGAAGSRRLLSGFYDLPDAYLAKHLQSLVKAGLLVATTGPHGGFRLARAPKEITVLDVVEAIEGRGPAFVCAEIRQRGVCAAPPEACTTACPIAQVMYDADEAWRRTLRKATIAQLARTLPPASRARSRAWLSSSPLP